MVLGQGSDDRRRRKLRVSATARAGASAAARRRAQQHGARICAHAAASLAVGPAACPRANENQARRGTAPVGLSGPCQQEPRPVLAVLLPGRHASAVDTGHVSLPVFVWVWVGVCWGQTACDAGPQ